MDLKNMDEPTWERLYKEWKKSRMIQKKFCETRGIDHQDFIYRRKKSEALKIFPAPGFIKLERESVPIPVPQVKQQESNFIELVLPHGIILRIPAHAPA